MALNYQRFSLRSFKETKACNDGVLYKRFQNQWSFVTNQNVSSQLLHLILLSPKPLFNKLPITHWPMTQWANDGCNELKNMSF